ncbi:MAG: cation transporter [Flavobacteriales bacterium]|nr:cation transporter [Flavobacteriales bacterium]
MKIYILTLILATAGLFAGAQASKTITFTVEGMTCDGCANTATKTLQGIAGVESAHVDFNSKTATVVGKITQTDITAAMSESTNFEVLFEGQSLIVPLTDKEKEYLDILTIKGGKKLRFREHLAMGKITIFDFYADWCGPCRVFTPKLEHLIKNNDNTALRKVDIVNWSSAVSKQLTKDYGMPALPFTLIFDDGGKLLGAVPGNRIKQVQAIVKENSK